MSEDTEMTAKPKGKNIVFSVPIKWLKKWALHIGVVLAVAYSPAQGLVSRWILHQIPASENTAKTNHEGVVGELTEIKRQLAAQNAHSLTVDTNLAVLNDEVKSTHDDVKELVRRVDSITDRHSLGTTIATNHAQRTVDTVALP